MGALTQDAQDAQRKSWLRDFDVETFPLTTTGGYVWDAAYQLFDFLEILNAEGRSWCEADAGFLDHSVVLELGSGCGWLGCNLARNLPAASFVLTEQETGGALSWLQHNVDRGDFPNASACALDWSQPDHGVEGPWDIIIGSDLVYNEIGARLLPEVMRAQVSACASNSSCRCDSEKPTTCKCRIRSKGIFYAHTFHRFDQFDESFLECLENQGLSVQEIPFDPSTRSIGEPKALEERFMEELFPEKRLAMLYISPAKE
eukprot:GEMP01012802.1.p1 GENE.GEMP01012802.1~~GEMP01012802.1.p1  ORF type:complete len:259 (+),score=47.58 GEMP01012802.1:79-855(+)